MKNPIDLLIDVLAAYFIKRGREEMNAEIYASSIVLTMLVMTLIIAGSFFLNWVYNL